MAGQFKYLVDKDCMVVFNNQFYAAKVNVFEVDTVGLWARCFKIHIEKPKAFTLPLVRREFTDETEDNLTFYPWTAIKSVKIIGEENENT